MAYVLRNIFLPQDRKTIKKDSKILFSADGGSSAKIF